MLHEAENQTGGKNRDDVSCPPYTDHSRSQAQLDIVATITAAAFSKDPIFPAKLHRIVSTREYEEIISWLPHGRAFRVLQPKAFEEQVIPKFFRHGKYASFARQINGWGFRRITTGPDFGAYYHELFLQGMPHLCDRMRRPAPGGVRKNSKLHRSDPSPDFYKISEAFPLPKDNDGQMLLPTESSDDKSPATTSGHMVNNSSIAVGPSKTCSEAAASLYRRAHAIPAPSAMPHVLPVTVPTLTSQQQAAKLQVTAALRLQELRHQHHPPQLSLAPSSGGTGLTTTLGNIHPNTTLLPLTPFGLKLSQAQASPSWVLLAQQQQQQHALHANILQMALGLNPRAIVPTPALVGGGLVTQQSMLPLPLATITPGVRPSNNNGHVDKIIQ